jgi:hypothetical protein
MLGECLKERKGRKDEDWEGEGMKLFRLSVVSKRVEESKNIESRTTHLMLQ